MAGKRNTTRKTAAKKSPAKTGVKPTSKLLKIPRTGSLAVRMAAAKKIEAMDRPTTSTRFRRRRKFPTRSATVIFPIPTSPKYPCASKTPTIP